MHEQQDIKWQRNTTLIPAYLTGWIWHPGSFMQKLQEQGAENSRILVLREDWQIPEAEEQQQLESEDDALIREVLIYNDNHKWMFARSVFPRSTLTGEQQCLANLQTRSLGSVLFKDPSIERSDFDVARITSDMAWHAYILQQAKITANELWARRSRFRLQKKPLLLTEVFLPDIRVL
jgi:chorismate--pyruvate lyase